MIEMIDITKRFGALVALDRVSLKIEGGRVHGVLGENGAGKSTVMNVLFGLLRADAGMIRVEGKEVRIGSPREAQGAGRVHQHFKLVPTLTVVENLARALGRSVRRVRGEAAQRFEELGWAVPVDVRVEELAVGQQQRVEIVKALMGMERAGRVGSRTLILDEPTAVLTPQETGELFAALEVLKTRGTGIVFISHKLAEVQRICDEVTILRRGKVVSAGTAVGMSAAEMTEKMVGASVELPRLVRGETKRAEKVVLELSGVTAGRMKGASLRVGAGEIVGVAGVDGNGQGELVQAIIGGMAVASGQIFLDGQDATRKSIRWRMEKVAYIAEDRQRQAVVLPLSIQNNLMLKAYRGEKFSTMGWLRFGAWRGQSRELVKRFDVRCGSVAETVGSLSGGNQQKVVLARELSESGKSLVVAVNPTRGLDVGATAFVMRQLLAARERGAGVLLVHSDLDELLAISDRVMVLFGGELRESDWPQGTKEGIGRMMMGAGA
jgi:ABC-type uncharacterized transport system ATPase subunit